MLPQQTGNNVPENLLFRRSGSFQPNVVILAGRGWRVCAPPVPTLAGFDFERDESKPDVWGSLKQGFRVLAQISKPRSICRRPKPTKKAAEGQSVERVGVPAPASGRFAGQGF